MNAQETWYNEVLILLGSVIIGISLLPIIVGIYKFKNLNRLLRFFLLYQVLLFLYNLFIQLFIWAVGRYTSWFLPFLEKFDIQNTHFLSIGSRLLDIFFVGFFFSVLLKEQLLSISVKFLTLITFLFAIYAYLFIDNHNEYGVVNPVMSKLFIILSSLLYIVRAFREIKLNISLNRNSYFIIAIGLLFPNLFSLLLSLFGDNLYQTDFILYIKMKILVNFFDIFGYVCFCIAFYHSDISSLFFHEKNYSILSINQK